MPKAKTAAAFDLQNDSSTSIVHSLRGVPLLLKVLGGQGKLGFRVRAQGFVLHTMPRSPSRLTSLMP